MDGSLDKSSTENIIQTLVAPLGLSVFDIECHPQVLRVFIQRDGYNFKDASENESLRNQGVGIEECSEVSRLITEHPRVEEILPGEMMLEVSSPGINRTLTKSSHFEGAVGERVRVKFKADGEPTKVVFGCVMSASSDSFEVEEEDKKELVKIFVSQVKEARIDFQF